MFEPRKINGFTRPKHPLQIFTYVYFLQLNICYSYIVLPSLDPVVLQIFAAIIFFTASFFTVFYTIIATYIDPTDDFILLMRGKQIIMDTHNFYCTTCDSHVSSNSKHCRVCDRCVKNFDHHCKWLNNCIGQKNYQSFFKLLIFVNLKTSTFIIFSVFTLKFPRLSNIWTWINIFIVGILFILNFNLTLFHVYLFVIKKSTYEYLQERKKKNSNKISSKDMLQIRNVTKQQTFPEIQFSQTHRSYEAQENKARFMKVRIQSHNENLKKMPSKESDEPIKNKFVYHSQRSSKIPNPEEAFAGKSGQNLLIEQNNKKIESESNTVNEDDNDHQNEPEPEHEQFQATNQEIQKEEN